MRTATKTFKTKSYESVNYWHRAQIALRAPRHESTHHGTAPQQSLASQRKHAKSLLDQKGQICRK